MTVKVLFVCYGNICRSPAAEGVMRDLLKKRGLDSKVQVDSAGILDFHAGELPDPRMRDAGSRRGYDFCHRSRQVRRKDFEEYDYIIGMDEQNIENLKIFAPRKAHKAQVSMLLDHCSSADTCEVPDPYYGGPAGFENVIDLVEKGCEALLDKITVDHRLS